MKVIITGAGGYIGSVATYLFLQNGFQVAALDNFSTGFKAPLEILKQKFPKVLTIYEQDLLNDLSAIFEKEQDAQAVIHYAACCLVDESVKNPQKYFNNNVGGSKNLFETMIKHKINNLVFSSTCAIYGNAKIVPIDENYPTLPNNPYGQSKLNTERLIQEYSKSGQLNYVILRYFNVYGASDDGLIGDSKKPSSLLVQNAVRGALGIAPFFLTCRSVDTPDKTPIRDYVNVVDLNLAHLKALNYIMSGQGSEIINIGSGSGFSVLEIVNLIQKVTGVKFDIQKTSPRQGEAAKLVASIEKAKQVLDWQPQRSLENSVTSLVTWYKAHPQGWDH